MKGITHAPLEAPGKISSRIRQQNQQRILAAAEVEFAQHGFNSARMGAIAQATGLPKANLHYYFKTKKSLYQTLLSTSLAAWKCHAPTLQVTQSPSLALSQYIQHKIHFARQNPHTSRLLAMELLTGGAHLDSHQQQVFQHWIDHLTHTFDAWSQAGTLRALDPRTLIIALWGSTLYYTDFPPLNPASPRPTKQTDMQLSQQLAELILHGCMPTHCPPI